MGIRCLIFGDGYFGNRINGFLENSVLSAKRINSSDDAIEEIKKVNPDVVINCIGRTGKPNIDWCEDHKIETITGNVTVPLLMLEACEKTGKRMVHLGSGCVYRGDNNGSGFSEGDEPNFFGSFYSRTKIYSEKILNEFNVLQLRIRIPMDVYPHPKNIIDKLVAYKKVINIQNSITYVPDFLDAMKRLIYMNKAGIFNVVNKGSISHPEILDLYKQIVDKNFNYEIWDMNEFKKNVRAERSNCVLSVDKLSGSGIEMQPVRDAVLDCLKKYKEAKV